MCVMCNVEVEVDVHEDVDEVSTLASTSCDFVCGIETASDFEDDLVTSVYGG